MKKLSKKWFELEDHRKRYFSKSTWVPVYGIQTIDETKTYPLVGYTSEVLLISAAVVFQSHRAEAEEQDWTQFSHQVSSAYLSKQNVYSNPDAFTDNSGSKIGFRLVLSQSMNSGHPPRVEIHQDFVFAYGLVEEGDKWLKPSAGYDEVIRVKRGEGGIIRFVEIRMEYLRDYLAARNAALRLYYYRERDAVLADKPDYGWNEPHYISDKPHDRCEVRITEIDKSGDIAGSTWALFTARRTDVDPEEEIPDFSSSTDENTESQSRQGKLGTENTIYRIQGELWRAEWIEPYSHSERLGWSEPEEDFSVYLDAESKKVSLESLNDETIGKYLWFSPSLVGTLLSNRNSVLKWYTKETGGVTADGPNGVHFGVNKLGLINTYAYDIARLSVWERRIWAAHNVKPDGGVSAELLEAQQKCKVADTNAPEFLIERAIDWLQKCCQEKYQVDICKEHPEFQEIATRLHRFRAIDENGLRGLGKDIVKFTIERFDKKALKQILKLKKSDLGTLKLLQLILASVTSEEFSKKHMAPLFGAYDLRGSDAHLASSNIEAAYTRINIDRSQPFIIQGQSLIKNIADTIGVIGTQIKAHTSLDSTDKS